MSDKKKILVIQNIHDAGIQLLKENSNYEFEIIEDAELSNLKSPEPTTTCPESISPSANERPLLNVKVFGRVIVASLPELPLVLLFPNPDEPEEPKTGKAF